MSAIMAVSKDGRIRGMRLPDFLVIGAQKAGTTWLRELLRTQPDIFMPPEEVHFFDEARNYRKGVEWYAAQFDPAEPDQVVGEKTPNYLYLPARPGLEGRVGEIHELMPDARLIVILRDPVTRAISALNHLVSIGEVSPLHPAEELLLGGKRDRVPWPVIEMGKYAAQLEAFLELYGRDQVLVLFFEDDVRSRPQETLDQVCDFIGVARRPIPRHRLENPLNRPRESALSLAIKHYLPALYRPTLRLTWRFPAYYPSVSDEARMELYRLFEPHNERLFELLGRRPASGWAP